jgi:hypothetical protein
MSYRIIVPTSGYLVYYSDRNNPEEAVENVLQSTALLQTVIPASRVLDTRLWGIDQADD